MKENEFFFLSLLLVFFCLVAINPTHLMNFRSISRTNVLRTLKLHIVECYFWNVFNWVDWVVRDMDFTLSFTYVRCWVVRWLLSSLLASFEISISRQSANNNYIHTWKCVASIGKSRLVCGVESSLVICIYGQMLHKCARFAMVGKWIRHCGRNGNKWATRPPISLVTRSMRICAAPSNVLNGCEIVTEMQIFATHTKLVIIHFCFIRCTTRQPLQRNNIHNVTTIFPLLLFHFLCFHAAAGWYRYMIDAGPWRNVVLNIEWHGKRVQRALADCCCDRSDTF